MNRYIPALGDEDVFLPAAEAFPEMVPEQTVGIGPLRSSPLPHAVEPDTPLRRKPRVPKELPRDSATELRNADLARWNDDYVENMISEARLKLQHKAIRISKRNARLFVHDFGIGGAGSRFSNTKLTGPLEIFSGDSLLETLTGVKTTTLGKKRPREEEGPGSDSEVRRVRMRESDGDQIGRGDELALNDDEPLAGEVSYHRFSVNAD